MQPGQQNNYWKHDTESDEVTEMYTPTNEDGNELLIADPEMENANIKKSTADNEPVHWNANEYIPSTKNALWYIIFTVVVLAFIAVDIFFIQSYTFSALVVVMAVAVIIYSRRPPKEIDYTLSGDQGLYIGEKLYHFSEFKSFGLINDREHHSIMLIPIKRFSPGVSVYFPKEVGEKIVDILGARLPMETLKIDFIDKIIQKLRL